MGDNNNNNNPYNPNYQGHPPQNQYYSHNSYGDYANNPPYYQNQWQGPYHDPFSQNSHFQQHSGAPIPSHPSLPPQNHHPHQQMGQQSHHQQFFIQHQNYQGDHYHQQQQQQQEYQYTMQTEEGMFVEEEKERVQREVEMDFRSTFKNQKFEASFLTQSISQFLKPQAKQDPSGLIQNFLHKSLGQVSKNMVNEQLQGFIGTSDSLDMSKPLKNIKGALQIFGLSLGKDSDGTLEGIKSTVVPAVESILKGKSYSEILRTLILQLPIACNVKNSPFTEEEYFDETFIPPPKIDFFDVKPQEDDKAHLFIDKEFDTLQSSLYSTKEKGIPSGVSKVTQWLRPSEFASNPRMFIDGSSAGDVIQGMIGDCWFIGALAILGGSQKLLQHCIVSMPSDATSSARYVFRFFKDGQWREVYIDDRLPCDSSEELVFARCKDPNEIWVPLFEKAYAKLHGSYQSLEGGMTSSALVDLTGGIALPCINISNTDSSSEKLWKRLKYFIESNCHFLSCSANGGNEEKIGDTGLLSGHAYSILDTKSVEGHKLIRIRNPWGEHEWKGRWSDNCKEWTPSIKKALGITHFENDGDFWMNYEDFCTYWTNIDVVRVFNKPDEKFGRSYAYNSCTDLEWNCQTRRGQWKGESAAGVFSMRNSKSYLNPQFFLELENDADVFICLMQKEYRFEANGKKQNLSIGMHVFRHQSEKPQRLFTFAPQQLQSKTEYWENVRECVIEQENMKSGRYIIVPSTYHPGNECEFIIRVWVRRSAFTLCGLN